MGDVLPTDNPTAPPPPPPSVWRRAGLLIRSRLLSGLFVLVPVGVTLMAVRFIIQMLGGFIIPLERILPPTATEWQKNTFAFLLFGLVVYLTGMVARHVIGRKLIGWFEALLMRIPVIKLIYSATKQIVEGLTSSSQSAFESVVVIDCFFPGFKTVGFQTGTLKDAAGRCYCKIFLPTSPNPTSGYLLLVPNERVHHTNLTVEEAFKIIVSAGMLAPTMPFLPATPDAPAAPVVQPPGEPPVMPPVS